MKLGGPLQLFLLSGLKDMGWFTSFYEKKSIDQYGKPIPWFTYPFFMFLKSRISPKIRILEYGCGSSTLWFSDKVREIVSIEHDKSWFNAVGQNTPSNAKLILKENNREDYALLEHKEYGLFELVIVDGLFRNECLVNSLNLLTDDGVVILDNSEREEYVEGVNFLIGQGFRKIDFWGMIPVVSNLSCTSIFYRPTNWMNI